MTDDDPDTEAPDGAPESRANAASPDEVERLEAALREQGRPYARVTVVRREPPVSANVGDRAVVTPGGDLSGWIGGAACAQSIAVERATDAIETGEPVFLGLAPDPDEIDRQGVEAYPMTCHSGGTLELFVEPVTPAPGLAVVGDSPIASAVVRLAGELDYEVTAVTDPERGPTAADETVAPTDVEAVVDALETSRFVVVASMGEYDDVGVEAGLRSGARYVGLVASDARRDELAGTVANRLDVDPESVANAVTTPAGLDVAAKTPEEIALSVLAELVAVRRDAGGAIELDRGAGSEVVDVADEGTDDRGDRASDGDADRDTVRDPVCGMTVDVDEAVTVELGGETHHFCGQGCADAFADDPERFADVAVTPDD